MDAGLREDFKERLRSLARARGRVCLHEHRPDAPDRLETLGWPPPAENVRIYRQSFLEAARSLRRRRFIEENVLFSVNFRARECPEMRNHAENPVSGNVQARYAAAIHPLGPLTRWRRDDGGPRSGSDCRLTRLIAWGRPR